VKECPPELFLSLPNVETFLPLFIDDDHLRGIFCVIDIDWYDEFDEFPLPIFAYNLHRAVRVEVIGAAYREIRGRSWSRGGAVAAFANIPLQPKTAKRNCFVILGDFAVDQRGFQIGQKAVTIQWQDGKQAVVWPDGLGSAPRFPTPNWASR
jgi:hypothetical protein